jgi:hypothetical protein
MSGWGSRGGSWLCERVEDEAAIGIGERVTICEHAATSQKDKGVDP